MPPRPPTTLSPRDSAVCSAESCVLCGTALLLLVGDAIIALWLGRGHFVGYPVLATFCLMLTLYVQQSMVLGFSRATENEVYANQFLLAGVLNLIFTWLLIEPLGLWGVALGTLFAQMLTTNWFIMLDGLRRLRIPWRRYAAEVLAPLCLVFAAACAMIFIPVYQYPSAAGPFARTLIGAVAAGCVCLGSLWLLALDQGDRLRFRNWAFGLFRLLVVHPASRLELRSLGAVDG